MALLHTVTSSRTSSSARACASTVSVSFLAAPVGRVPFVGENEKAYPLWGKKSGS